LNIEFNTSPILGKIPVSHDMKQYYELFIQILMNNLFSFFDTSKLEKIIIPNDFISGVMDFQITLGDNKRQGDGSIVLMGAR
jgi:hypothetical protein